MAVRRAGLRGADVPNDIWSSSDGIDWTKVGTAAWSPRGATTIVVYHDQLWLFGGANHIARRPLHRRIPQRRVGVRRRCDLDTGDRRRRVVAAGRPRRDRAERPAVRRRRARPRRRVALTERQGLDPTRDARPVGPRHGAAHVVFDGKLWVFGGFIGTSTNALQRRLVLRRRRHVDPASRARAVGATPPGRDRVPRQDLDLQRQAHRRRRQLGRRPLADDHRRSRRRSQGHGVADASPPPSAWAAATPVYCSAAWLPRPGVGSNGTQPISAK